MKIYIHSRMVKSLIIRLKSDWDYLSNLSLNQLMSLAEWQYFYSFAL
ncbi:hypothetical protein [Ancylomarina euxinus]|nr:hypothetical protein [Ancylomarina euxinus]MCZ4695659.1 hypothetical protein [Ancylomarina euxinus]MUP16037.1 hypothetical protein [Ancylomarina euxinus]